jgi:7-hydroxymethyl chlorophyll a reductase
MWMRMCSQWTGIVTEIAINMLESGTVDAVVCVQSQDGDRMAPKPVVARTAAEVIAAKGVKPSLSPNLNVLATIEALPDVKRLLFIGVGCQVPNFNCAAMGFAVVVKRESGTGWSEVD